MGKSRRVKPHGTDSAGRTVMLNGIVVLDIAKMTGLSTAVLHELLADLRRRDWRRRRHQPASRSLRATIRPVCRGTRSIRILAPPAVRMPGGVEEVQLHRHAVEPAAIGSTADFFGSLSRVGTCAIARHFHVGVDARIQLLDAAQKLFGQFGRRHAARLDKARRLRRR